MELSVVSAYAAAVVAAGLAVAWLLAKHEQPSHWSFGFGLLLLAADTGLGGLAAGAFSTGDALGWQAWRIWCAALLPGTWLVYGLCYSRGNYREFLAHWRGVIAAAFGVPLLLATIVQVSGGHEATVATDAVSARAAFLPVTWAGKGIELAVLMGSLVTLIHLEKTFRSALGLMRWRVKFVVLGLAVVLGGRIYVSSQVVLFSGVQLSLVGVLAVSLLLGVGVIGFSMARTGLREIDVYPSQAMLYGSLSILLAGIYLLTVGLLAEVVAHWGGDQGFTLKSLFLLLAVVGLAVLFLSDRFRQRCQLLISRHLRRPLHDYRQVWTNFTERTATQLHRETYCRAVVTLVAETFNALSVTVWLVDESRQRLTFGGSTSLNEDTAGTLLWDGSVPAELLAAVQSGQRPFDLEKSGDPWARTLMQGNPDHFHKGGGQVCVPLSAAGQTLGLMLLGDRVSGFPFTPEDIDLLKCIGDQVAAGLLNLQLSRKLIEAKELEAFQAMSTFFVHDLKNTASTLSMMLQNLPVHFNNPEFRTDALRGIAKSVHRVNGLIERLSLLRHGFSVRPVDTDLNTMVAAAVSELDGTPGLKVVSHLEPMLRVAADPEQFPKVLTNLLLNAREAVGEGGRIEVVTSHRDNAAVVRVTDNGCGMTPEYVGRRLFRPFQTTKQRGLGIGLFQSRMITEAHGGRIEVESEPGKGTTFSVVLPMSRRTNHPRECTN